MTPEEFRRDFDASFVDKGFFEIEIGHRIERFGNVAAPSAGGCSRRIADDTASIRTTIRMV